MPSVDHGSNGAEQGLSKAVSKVFQSYSNRKIFVRNATLDDAQGIAAVGAEVFSASFGYSMEPKDLKEYLDQTYTTSAICQTLSDPNNHFLVGIEDNTVVAFATITDGPIESEFSNMPKPVELRHLYLHENQHGTGLAKFMVDEALVMAKQFGYQTVLLGVWEDNFKAQKFYKKMGFERVGEHDFVIGATRQTDWVLSKDL